MFIRSNWRQNALLFRTLLICFLVTSPQLVAAQATDPEPPKSQSSAQAQADEIDALIQKSQANIEELQSVVGDVDGFQKKIEQMQSHLQTLAKKQAMNRQQLEASRQSVPAKPAGSDSQPSPAVSAASDSSLLSREQIVDVGPAAATEPEKSQLSFERIVIIVILVLLIVVIALLFRLTVSMRRAPIPRPVKVSTEVGEVRERHYDPIVHPVDTEADKTVVMEKPEEPQPGPQPAVDLTHMDFELDDEDAEPVVDEDETPYPPLDALPDDVAQKPLPDEEQVSADSYNEQIVAEISDQFKALASDAVASKIAMANTYLQMKDLDSAKTLLVEVFKEGDVEHQQQAVDLVERIEAEANHTDNLTITESLHLLDSTQPLRENDRVTEISDRFRMLADDEVSQLFALAQLQYEMGEFRQARESISRVLGQSGEKYKSEAIDLLFKVEAEDQETEEDITQAIKETESSKEEEVSPWEFTSVKPSESVNHDQPLPEAETATAEEPETTDVQEGTSLKMNLGLPDESDEETRSDSASSVFDLQFESADETPDESNVLDSEQSPETDEGTTNGPAESVFDLEFESADETKIDSLELETETPAETVEDENDNSLELELAPPAETSEPAETIEEVKSSSVVDQNVVKEISERFRALSENEHGAKLALAYVYLDMKELDLAREFLNEVIAFGEDQYKEEAQRLLDKIESGQTE